MAYRFNPPPGWQVAEGFTPGNDWRPDPAWPAAPEGWEFWVAVPDAPPPPPPPPGQPAAGPPAPEPSAGTGSAATASTKMSGMFKSLKSKAQDEDWMGKAKAAATQASATAQQAAGQAIKRPRRGFAEDVLS